MRDEIAVRWGDRRQTKRVKVGVGRKGQLSRRQKQRRVPMGWASSQMWRTRFRAGAPISAQVLLRSGSGLARCRVSCYGFWLAYGPVVMRALRTKPVQAAKGMDVIVFMPRQVQRRQAMHSSDVQNEQQAGK